MFLTFVNVGPPWKSVLAIEGATLLKERLNKNKINKDIHYSLPDPFIVGLKRCKFPYQFHEVPNSTN